MGQCTLPLWGTNSHRTLWTWGKESVHYVRYDGYSVYITATIGAAASLLGGDTTDGSVYSMKKGV